MSEEPNEHDFKEYEQCTESSKQESKGKYDYIIKQYFRQKEKHKTVCPNQRVYKTF